MKIGKHRLLLYNKIANSESKELGYTVRIVTFRDCFVIPKIKTWYNF